MNSGILIIDSAENSLEPLLSRLRMEHLAGDARRVMHKQDLADQLLNAHWDMVLVNEEANSISPEECRSMIDHHRLDTLTVLVCMKEPASAQLEACISHGIEGPLSVVMEDYSVNWVRRLLAGLAVRRRLDELEHINGELADRCHRLLNNASDAVAYLHEGMHVYANPVYREMFGFSDEAMLISTPFIDMVSDDEKPSLRQILSSATGLSQARAGGCEEETKLTLHDLEGNSFPVVMKYVATSYEGESCLQVVLSAEDTAKNGSSPVLPDVDHAPSEPAPSFNENAELPAPEELMLYYRPVFAVTDIETECFDIVPGPGNERLWKRIADSAQGDRYDARAIQMVLDVQTALYKRGQSLQFMLALSAASLKKTGIAGELLSLFNKRGLDAGTMIIRIRQQDVLDYPEHAQEIFTGLGGSGFRFCIDEYRPDNTIDALLKNNRIHFCRIHQAFLLEEVAGIVESLHENRVRVLAGGVDTSEKLGCYWRAGVDLIQGSYFQTELQPFSIDAVSGQMEIIKDAV